VIYFCNPSTPAVRAAMQTDPRLGCIETPKSGRNRVPVGVRWCADNGCFGKGYPGDDAWFRWLEQHPGRELCEFAVAPDVVADHEATLERSLPWLERIRALGLPAAFVAQDGATVETIPWDRFDVLFVGGSTEWKLGAVAEQIVRMAADLGYPVHMGRVNSHKRLAYADAIGCTSADGTFLARGPDVNLPKVLRWLRRLDLDRPLVIS